MKGRWIHLKDVELDRRGWVIARKPRRQSVSERLRQKHSKRVKVARKLTRV
jgi:hypothetical protein